MIGDYLTQDQIVMAKEILNSGCYINKNNHTGNTLGQDVIIIKYLMEECESKKAAFNRWYKIYQSAYGCHIDEDFDEDFYALKLFDGFWNKAVMMSPLNKIDIIIEEATIDAISLLDVPRWVKELLLLSVVYCKINKKTQFSNLFFSKLLKFTSKSRRTTQDSKIAKDWFIKYGLLKEKETKTFDSKAGEYSINTSYEFCFDGLNGIGAASFQHHVFSLKDGTKLFKLIKMVRICSCCGKVFDINSKTKRDVCQECWFIKEKERVRLAVNKVRKRKM